MTWTPPTAMDNSGGEVTVISSHNPGDQFSVGTTQVTYTFRDFAGNQAQCSFTITGNLPFYCSNLAATCNKYGMIVIPFATSI